MMLTRGLQPGASCRPHSVIAHNFAGQSTNKIHSDEIAAQYGFRGGLVPGVALYAYMSVPVVAVLGREFLARGGMHAKFIHPIYHAERATAHAAVVESDPLRLELALHNQDGKLCAVGEAALPASPRLIDTAAYACRPVPQTKFAPTVDALPSGTTLGSLGWTHDGPGQSGEFNDVLEEFRDPLPVYREADAPPHAALYAMKANRLLADNVDLGPWIHTASDIQFYAIPNFGERLTLSGRIAESYVRRGHDMVTLDLAVLGKNDRALAHVLHTAIVRPATPQRS
jgi:hypothetical protein